MIYELKAKVRQAGKVCQPENNHEFIAGVVYGPGIKENVLLCLDLNEVEKIYYEAGESSLINLNIDGEKEPREVLFKDVFKNVMTTKLHHVDFYQFKAGQKLDVDVELVFVGESPAVKGLGGIFVASLDKLAVRCLPKDMINKIEVNISSLQTFEDKIRVKDLQIPAGLEVMAEAEETIAVVAPPNEEEKETVVVTPTAEMPEVAAKGKAATEGAEAEKK
ncbi:MAG: 50S ribosomal protein L25 [Patescibacteria group bacterium]